MNDRGWNPYLAGALAGLLVAASVWVTTALGEKPQFVGASTTFVRSAGMILERFAPEHVEKNAYYQSKKVKIDWQWMFVLGIVIGALISSVTSKSFKLESSPPMWRDRFRGGVPWRAVVAFVGGVIALFGARLAGGCPSGHGLSGMMQLSVSALLSTVCFFIGGVAVARMLYAGRGGSKA